MTNIQTIRQLVGRLWGCECSGDITQIENGYFRANATVSPPGHCHVIFEISPLGVALELHLGVFVTKKRIRLYQSASGFSEMDSYPTA